MNFSGALRPLAARSFRVPLPCYAPSTCYDPSLVTTPSTCRDCTWGFEIARRPGSLEPQSAISRKSGCGGGDVTRVGSGLPPDWPMLAVACARLHALWER